eukprot:COSAG05_NODE_11_length_38500_cov_831.349861_1_plen_337_part_00
MPGGTAADAMGASGGEGTASGQAEGASLPEGVPKAKAPQQLAVLVKWLPKLTGAYWRQVVAAAIETGEGEVQVGPELEASLYECNLIDATEQQQVIQQCVFLRRQATKGGVSAEVFSNRLKPMGFTSDHLSVLLKALDGASPRAIQEASPRDVPATARANIDDIVQRQLEKQMKKMEEDHQTDEEEEEEDDDGDDMYGGGDDGDEYFNDMGAGQEGSTEWAKSKLSQMASRQLKVLLQATAQHMVGYSLGDEEMDAVEQALDVVDVEPKYASSVLRLVAHLIAEWKSPAVEDEPEPEPEAEAATRDDPLRLQLREVFGASRSRPRPFCRTLCRAHI